MTLDETYTRILVEIPQFAKDAADIFEKMGWEWYDGVPNAERIDGVAYHLLQDAYKAASANDMHADASTGRVCVSFNKYPSGWVGQLRLHAICHTR